MPEFPGHHTELGPVQFRTVAIASLDLLPSPTGTPRPTAGLSNTGDSRGRPGTVGRLWHNRRFDFRRNLATRAVESSTDDVPRARNLRAWVEVFDNLAATDPLLRAGKIPYHP